MRARTTDIPDIIRTAADPTSSRSASLRADKDELLAKVLAKDYGTLTVVSEVFWAVSSGRSRPYVRTSCSLCGSVRDRLVENLLRGKIKNCRCAPKKYDDDRKLNLSDRYFAMDRRCNNPEHPDWENYGGRGIKNEFTSVEEYVEYVFEHLPHKDYKGVHIDRIDNDGNYAKGNLRCVLPKINLANTRRCKKVTYYGEEIPLAHLWHLIKYFHPEWPYDKGTVKRLHDAEVLPEEMHTYTRPLPGGRPPSANKKPDQDVLALYHNLIAKVNKESAQ